MALWLWPGNVYLDISAFGLALFLDLVLPEPPNAIHPVVWMGKCIHFFERIGLPLGSRIQFAYGLLIALASPLFFGVLVGVAGYGLRQVSPVAYVLVGAIMLRSVFTVRGLGKAGKQVEEVLSQGDVDAARRDLRSLVSRDTSKLSKSQAAGAAIESVAENTTDSFVAPWLAFAVFGLPGAYCYRVVNTLDSMIGYREKYEWLGKASARLDDGLNFLPSRISALLLLAAGVVRKVDARRGWSVMRRDHGLTASPNAGWTMSAASGLLGVALGKPGHYLLGEGLREPVARDIGAAVTLCYAVGVLGALVAGSVTLFRACVTS